MCRRSSRSWRSAAGPRPRPTWPATPGRPARSPEAARRLGHVFEKVLLAVDGSAESARAVPVATDLAKKSDGEELVFHAREFMIARGAAGGRLEQYGATG